MSTEADIPSKGADDWHLEKKWTVDLKSDNFDNLWLLRVTQHITKKY